jgi:hypothetical protein
MHSHSNGEAENVLQWQLNVVVKKNDNG